MAAKRKSGTVTVTLTHLSSGGDEVDRFQAVLEHDSDADSMRVAIERYLETANFFPGDSIVSEVV